MNVEHIVFLIAKRKRNIGKQEKLIVKKPNEASPLGGYIKFLGGLAMKELKRIFPSGNKSDFPFIDEQLRKQKVKFRMEELSSGGRIYYIQISQLRKLPHDEQGPYLPVTDDSGFSIY